MIHPLVGAPSQLKHACRNTSLPLDEMVSRDMKRGFLLVVKLHVRERAARLRREVKLNIDVLVELITIGAVVYGIFRN